MLVCLKRPFASSEPETASCFRFPFFFSTRTVDFACWLGTVARCVKKIPGSEIYLRCSFWDIADETILPDFFPHPRSVQAIDAVRCIIVLHRNWSNFIWLHGAQTPHTQALRKQLLQCTIKRLQCKRHPTNLFGFNCIFIIMRLYPAFRVHFALESTSFIQFYMLQIVANRWMS